MNLKQTENILSKLQEIRLNFSKSFKMSVKNLINYQKKKIKSSQRYIRHTLKAHMP
jgi:hypothetical protein